MRFGFKYQENAINKDMNIKIVRDFLRKSSWENTAQKNINQLTEERKASEKH